MTSTARSVNRGRGPWILLWALAMAVWPLAVAACHTVEGASRDVAGVGRGIETVAADTRHAVFGTE